LGGCGTGAQGQTGPPYDGDILQFDAATQKWVTEPGLWEDLRVPVTATNNSSARPPTFSRVIRNGTSEGVYTYFFSNIQEQELFFNVQLPHSYDEGTDIEPHVHWLIGATVAGATGVLQWGLEYTWANIDSDFTDPTTIINSDLALLTAATPRFRHFYTDFPFISGTVPDTKRISSMLMCRVFRNVAVTANFNASIAMLEIDFHFRMCGNGSTQEYIK